MGMAHLNYFGDLAGALCDVDDNHLRRAAQRLGRHVPQYKDFRRLLDQKDIDGVVIATPDHWHAVMTILACEAGKDVYVQKPASKTVVEGRKMVQAARRCGRVVQVGSQGRSSLSAYRSAAYIRNGEIGDVREIRCWHYENPVGGNAPDTPPPSHLDWDLWLGPAAYVPYNRERSHFFFRWFLDFGGGQIRDRGAHVMSVACFVMNADATGPVAVEATGTAPERGLWDCPTQMDVKYTFKNPDWTLHWSQPGTQFIPKEAVEYANYNRERPPGFGAVYEGTRGRLVVGGGDGGTFHERRIDNYRVPAGGVAPYRSPGHEQDWVDCIKTRRRPIMDIEAGHRVATLCILGNIAYRLGRRIEWDPVEERCVGDDEANRMLDRPNRAPWRI